MKIAILSQREDMITFFQRTTKSFSHNAYININIVCFRSQEELLASLVSEPLDVLFFDFEGVENVEYKVREVVHAISMCKIILLGEDNRYALFGYEVSAKDYLVTPIHRDDLINVFIRLLRNKLELVQQVLPIKLNGHWTHININRLSYIESTGHYLTFHMDNGTAFKNNATFKDYDVNITMNSNLLRCHQSYVINLQQVDMFDQNCFLMKTGMAVNVSRTYKQMSRGAYAKFQVSNYNSTIKPVGCDVDYAMAP